MIATRHLILALIVAMFVADAANSILLNSGAAFYRVSLGVRLVAIACFFWLLLRTRTGLRVALFVAALGAVLLAGLLAAPARLAPAALAENVILVVKAVFFFVAYGTLSRVFREPAERRALFRLFEWLVLIQSAVILASFAFRWELFAAYGGVRFGYQGLIPSQNEVGGFYLIAFFYALYKLQVSGGQRRLADVLLLFATLIAGLFTGTRVALILPALLAVLLAAWLLRGRLDRRRLAVVLVALLLAGLAWAARDALLERIAPTIAYYRYALSRDPTGSLFNALTGDRRTKVLALFAYYLPRFGPANVLFGGLDLAGFATETDLLDVFARLGLVGGLLFYAGYLRALAGSRAELARPLRLLFVLTWLAVSTIAGHTIFTAINGTYLAILLLAFGSPPEALPGATAPAPAIARPAAVAGEGSPA